MFVISSINVCRGLPLLIISEIRTGGATGLPPTATTLSGHKFGMSFQMPVNVHSVLIGQGLFCFMNRTLGPSKMADAKDDNDFDIVDNSPLMPSNVISVKQALVKLYIKQASIMLIS